MSKRLPQITLVGGDGGNSGVPRHMLHLADSFQDVADVTLISDRNEGGFDTAKDVNATHITLPGLQTRRSFSHLCRGWRGLSQHLCRSSADLVWLHARMPVLMGRLAMALRIWRPKSRVAVTFHGLPFGAGHRPRNSHISKTIERILLSLCPPLDLIFLSQTMADQMAQAMGVRRMKRHRVHVLPNCSDLRPLPPKQSASGTHLVMTGRVGWQKNYPLAAQILAHLPPSYSLTLCGAGTDDPAFQQTLARSVPSDVAQRIHFAGPLRDVRTALQTADGYMLCSRYEGLPIGTLEAFEVGLPVILSRFEGADELAKTSPYTEVLDFVNLDADALKIEALIGAFRIAKDDPRAAIQDQWQRSWSPKVFRVRSRALLDSLVT